MEPPKRHQITVTARASFVPEQSDEQEGRYVFAYTISILNSGTVAARLISRHWIITDSDNQVQEVRGLGVVGEQPLLAPGQSFQYS
ncbi:MAG: Co2+/Mg2+ efflux protein ApaG, partial [Betaproteobacteria bacterium]